MKLSVLLIEDSPEYTQIIWRALPHLEIVSVTNVEDANRALRQRRFDLILLDLSLPGQDGYTILTRLHESEDLSDIPVICVTSRSGIADKVAAFSLGVADYLVKPFDPVELRARVDSKLSRKNETPSSLRIGNLVLNFGSRTAFVQSASQHVELDLTHIEFKILSALAARKGIVFSRSQLIEKAWPRHAAPTDRAVDVHVCSLRKKLQGARCEIKSVTGLGYRLIERAAPF